MPSRRTCVAGLWMLVAACQGSHGAADAPEAPALSTPSIRCAEHGDLRYLARMALRKAEVELQRAPFVADRGASALPLLAQAEGCFTAAGDGHAAARVRTRRQAHFASLREYYRLLQVRLQQALSTGQHQQARGIARRLRALVGSDHDDYLRYLAHIEHGRR